MVAKVERSAQIGRHTGYGHWDIENDWHAKNEFAQVQ